MTIKTNAARRMLREAGNNVLKFIAEQTVAPTFVKNDTEVVVLDDGHVVINGDFSMTPMVKETAHGDKILYPMIDRAATRLAKRGFDVKQRGNKEQVIIAKKRVRMDGRLFRIRLMFNAQNGRLKVNGGA